jgi:hypothetical protein
VALDEQPDACAASDAGFAMLGTESRRVCTRGCLATERLDAHRNPFASPSPKNGAGQYLGWTAWDVRSAYEVPDAGAPAGGAPLVAIVVDGSNPYAESDLSTYRAEFRLGPCTVASGCLTIMSAGGPGVSLPPPDEGFTLEIVLDLEAASATCPACRLLLIEADPFGAPRYQYTKYDGIRLAARQGATVISNSWVDVSAFGDTDAQAALDQPGIGVFFAGDDDNYCPPPCLPDSRQGVLPYPASYPGVWSVGGTTLARLSTSARGWAESAWSGSGSACVEAEPQPPWQSGLGVCSGRATNDIAALADDFLIVDTYPACGGWRVVGGTSLATALMAGLFAATGHGQLGPGYAYEHPELFNDVVAGSNGSCDGGAMCTAGRGYDGPTGWGSPNATLLSAAGAAANR